MAAPPAAPPARSRRASALPADERRRAIVAATLPLVLTHGRAVTSRQIAEAAGVAEGTVFRVFADKDELIEAVVEHALDPAPLTARLDAIDRSLPLRARLEEAVRALQERAIGVWQLATSVGMLRTPGGRPPQLPDLGPLAAVFGDDVAELRFDALAAAGRLRALAIAGVHPGLAGDEPLGPDEVVSLFLDGARRRPTTGRSRC